MEINLAKLLRYAKSLSLRERADERSSLGEATKFRPIRGGQAASARSRLVGFINQLSLFPLIKGAVTALAVTEGLLLSVCLVSLPVSAADPATISLSPSSDNLTIDVPTDGGIATASHSLHIITNDQVQDYTVTLESSGSGSGSNTLVSTNPKAPTINSITGTKQLLAGNTWGYTLGTKSTIDPNKATAIWNEVPLSNSTNKATIDSGSKLTQAVDKDISVTYGVNMPKPVHGTYTTNVTYTATATPKPQEPAGDVCAAGNSESHCVVDIDPNMIPVKYTGNTTTPQWTVTSTNDPEWYNYGEKKWANAVTVKTPANYKNSDGSYKAGTVMPESDALGYWVYIPRYRYQVMTIKGSDPTPKARNFTIQFQNKDDKVNIPTVGVGNSTEINEQAWATHPAFRWCTNPDYTDAAKTTGCIELNGFWMGKFEITGTLSDPTILPSTQSLIGSTIGDKFDSAKSIGAKDSVAKNYGNGGIASNKHGLANMTSHMLKNSEWGSAAYLSASIYGSGVNNVKNNASYSGETGCGPLSENSDDVTGDCSTYITTLGQLASTTGNVAGVYDMAGGMWEYVMGNYGTSIAVNPSGLTNKPIVYPPKPPYVDLYGGVTSSRLCTWAVCGGHALYETVGWGSDSADFVIADRQWFYRGGAYAEKSGAGLFFSGIDEGDTFDGDTFRVALRES